MKRRLIAGLSLAAVAAMGAGWILLGEQRSGQSDSSVADGEWKAVTGTADVRAPATQAAHPKTAAIASAHESDEAPDLGGVDWADEHSPYLAYDNATLAALARNGDAEAAERLSMNVHQTAPEEARYHALAAAALSGKPEAVMTLTDNMDNTQAREALPYVIVAGRLGHPIAKLKIDGYLSKKLVTKEDVEAAQREADALFAQMQQIRLERLGTRLHEGRGK